MPREITDQISHEQRISSHGTLSMIHDTVESGLGRFLPTIEEEFSLVCCIAIRDRPVPNLCAERERDHRGWIYSMIQQTAMKGVLQNCPSPWTPNEHRAPHSVKMNK